MVLLAAAVTQAHSDDTPIRMVRQAAAFDRAQFTELGAAEQVRIAGDLKGTTCCVSGWVEYDFDITTGGWYQLWLDGSALETLVDASSSLDGEPAAYFSGGSGLPGDVDKIGNVWLDWGRHRVRLQDYRWYGFSRMKSIELRRSDAGVAGAASISWPRAGQIFRVGQCPSFELLWGGNDRPASIQIVVRDRNSGVSMGRSRLALPASPGLARQRFTVPCSLEGSYRVSAAEVLDGRTRDIDWRGIKGFDFDVVDTRPMTDGSRPSGAREVLAIDCAASKPDYESGESSVRESAWGPYRQSGDSGWMPQHKNLSRRLTNPDPSWFAYTLTGVVPGRRYHIAVDYPDDEDRTFAVVLRETQQHAYPVAIGMDTGGPYPLSYTLQTATMTVWPRSAAPRLLFMGPHDGKRAACKRIRIAELTPTEPALASAHVQGNRQFAYWYEEGINFIDMFGASSEEPAQIARAIDRWCATAVEQGASTLIPTVLVYGGQLYPSRYNLMQMFPDRDPLRRLLLSAERHHLAVIAELHPRSDELLYGKTQAAGRHLLLVSKDGSDNYTTGDGKTRNVPPFYNVLLPEVQDWFVNMVTELALRYRDSPAFEGISLRYMPWSNAALDNLVNLDWGYDDATVGRFEQETGVIVPNIDAAGSDRYARRHAWLTTAAREAWVRWRCAQIAGLVERIAARLRHVRPDLKLFIHAFPSDPERPYLPDNGTGLADTPRSRLREAALDLDALVHIPGVILIDSTASYGRDRPDAVAKGLLGPLKDPALIRSLRSDTGLFYLPSHRYLEATDAVVPPDLLGYPKDTKASWLSVAANAPGRNALERFAVGLAEGDALMLGDGGNGYVYSVPGLHDFLTDYTRLPAANFQTETDTDAGVVVRTRKVRGAWWLYAVNRKGAVQCVELPIKGSGGLTRLANDSVIARAGSPLVLQLAPYELIAMRGGDNHSLEGKPVSVSCAAHVDRYQSLGPAFGG